MAKDTSQPSKKVIHFVDSSVDSSKVSGNAQWQFAELLCEDMDTDFFTDIEDGEVFEYKDVLSWCVSVLETSPTARIMLKEAADKNWILALDDLHGADYCIDVENKTISLDNNSLVPSALGRSVYFRNITLVTLVKALRDIWQEKRYGGFDEIYAPEHVMLMERIRAADLDVVAVLVAWELRSSEDHPDIWRHMIGSEIGDMAMNFSGYLERDPTAQFNGHGLHAAFKQWFRDEARVNRCDHDTLDYMDEVLSTSATTNPFGSKKPGKMNIEMLSCLPDKTAYLQGQGAEIMADPMFAGVDDEINQTHLLQIMHEMQAVIVENVPFRDMALAKKIFPQEG